ncbi:hypothetical protein CMV_005434 [Castanea mollissima]|uniref:Uncharacterized protein n=1 Tax=Castanea mollissima TaxID=60419 RepID=A0A8J4RCZ0_9ROSI|nr:hypothetical protein CMV_005434 [Castanea mollissima]
MAKRRAVEFALELSITTAMVEGDSNTIYKKLINSDLSLALHGHLNQDLLTLRKPHDMATLPPSLAIQSYYLKCRISDVSKSSPACHYMYRNHIRYGFEKMDLERRPICDEGSQHVGRYTADSSSFIPLDVQSSVPDSRTSTSETPFIQTSAGSSIGSLLFTRFPHWKRSAEIDTKFCNDVRNFWRGEGLLSDLATRLCGSGDIFSDGRGPAFSFNFIARNFGLTLVDLVSFSNDALASQLSWNCGEEGPTDNTTVLERRLKQIHNFLFVLHISLGVPILNMGDECGQSCGGSPAYGDRKPLDWNTLKTGFGIQTLQFISFLRVIFFRKGIS